MSRPFDIAELVGDPIVAQGFIADAVATGDAAEIAEAIGIVARAQGMSKLASDAGMSRESLYRALSPKGNPTLSTLLVVLKALGFKLSGVERINPA
ncbi:putative addiction module antidote protein [Bosea vaviloviae]|uniref:Putative addiction module antidote protein n=1 Tax=Bosea vaviloviae TaxID=1526658 RepID=A0A1D7UAJ3_9HYPH|nr:putative addiction module antidote protein [Bosea vaviloviae]